MTPAPGAERIGHLSPFDPQLAVALDAVADLITHVDTYESILASRAAGFTITTMPGLERLVSAGTATIDEIAVPGPQATPTFTC